MKKFNLFLILFLFSFCLFGCGVSNKLDAPSNLRVEDNKLYWNTVDYAEKYIVSVNGNEYISLLNYYDISGLNGSASYVFKVKAISNNENYLNSDFSKEYVYNVGEVGGNGETSGENVITSNDLNVKRYITHKDSQSNEVMYSFSDGRYNYFYVYLGYIEKVPVAYEPAEFWNGSVKPQLSYTITNYNEQQVSETLSTCITNSVEQQNQVSVNVSAGLQIYAVEVNAGVGLSFSNTSSSSKSTTKTTSSLNTWSETHTKTISYELDSNCPYGYYRYTLFATCDVYVVIVHDKHNNSTSYDYLTCARENTYHYAIDYSATETFSKDVNSNQIPFDFSIINQIDLNANLPVSSGPDFISLPYNKVVLSSNEEYKVIASGTWLNGSEKTDWGLSHEADAIDLSDYTEYMTAQYEWEFTIKVDIEEIEDGYQEVYLYNQLVKHGSVSSSDLYDESFAKECGLVKAFRNHNYSIKANDKWTAEMKFTLAGSECKKSMYVRYGAHGEFGDDWLKKGVKVIITITEKGK